MGRFKINIVNNSVVGCKEVTRRSNMYDFIQINQLQRFVEYDEALNPKAYLCKASSETEAIRLATDYLSNLKQKETAREQTS